MHCASVRRWREVGIEASLGVPTGHLGKAASGTPLHYAGITHRVTEGLFIQ